MNNLINVRCMAEVETLLGNCLNEASLQIVRFGNGLAVGLETDVVEGFLIANYNDSDQQIAVVRNILDETHDEIVLVCVDNNFHVVANNGYHVVERAVEVLKSHF